MALSTAIEQARQQGATRAARQSQARAELRLEEIVKVSGIADDYTKADRRGDLNVERAFANLYRCAPNEGMRDLITRTYMAWMKDEQDEEAAVMGSVGSAVKMLKDHNPVWIDGASVPFGSDGAA